jgi:hypothetical protein
MWPELKKAAMARGSENCKNYLNFNVPIRPMRLSVVVATNSIEPKSSVADPISACSFFHKHLVLM